MIRFYLDENVQGEITRGLRQAGIDVLTVQEDGREGLPDPSVLDRAGELGRVLFSQDSDLLVEASRRQSTWERFGGVIYARQNVVPNGRCVADLHLIAETCSIEDFLDFVCYLPL
jgi:predicted nuclease of predicted toxin-antitoxin system